MVIRITALMENMAGREDLRAEHGLSLLIEYGDRRVLFDCGQSGAFLENARCLGISLEDLDAVMLSHSHYDHARGYRDLAASGKAAPVLYTGTGFFEPKYSRQEEGYSDRSCGFEREFPEEHRVCHREVENMAEIFPGMWLLTGFPRKAAFETIPEKFLRKTETGYLPDDFHDEVCLVLEAEGGVVMLVGCSHPGIVNMVTEVKARLGKPVRAVFGGTHLSEAPIERLRSTLDALADAGVETLGFCHCSGSAVEALVEGDSRFTGCHLAAGNSKMIHF